MYLATISYCFCKSVRALMHSRYSTHLVIPHFSHFDDVPLISSYVFCLNSSLSIVAIKINMTSARETNVANFRYEEDIFFDTDQV